MAKAKAKATATAVQPKGDVAIMVLQRGWVIVGRLASTSDTTVVITGASVIRYWGTTRGLGELAANGPTATTKLDPAGTVRVHPLGVVLRIDCNQDKWEGLCNV